MSQLTFKNYNFLWTSIIKQVFERSHTRNVYISSLYCKDNKVEGEENLDTHSTNYEDTSLEYGIGKKYAIMKLQQLFNLRLFTATDVATRFKKLQLVTGKTMTDNYNLLTEEGVTDSIILQYPDLLAQKSMEKKIELLKDLPYNVSDVAPLLNMELKKLQRFINKQNKECITVRGGRIRFLSRLLELPIVTTCDIITRREFIQNVDLTKLEKNLKLLIEFGIELDEIKRDYWVLSYNSDIIHDRLQIVKDLDVGKIKTWMVRAQPEIFNKYVQRRSENKSILGESSLAEYLSERLQCDIDKSKHILTKHPALLGKSMKKMKEIIDFLIQDGYTPQHIVRNPKVLLHSVETTRKRLKELEGQGTKVDSLHILTKSQKQYMNYYESLVKSNKNKMQNKN